jgi:hypothetical protein
MTKVVAILAAFLAPIFLFEHHGVFATPPRRNFQLMGNGLNMVDHGHPSSLVKHDDPTVLDPDDAHSKRKNNFYLVYF